MYKNLMENIEMPDFTPACFWDIDYTKLDIVEDRSYIIGRVINRGLEKDIYALFRIFGWDTMRQEILKTKYMNKKVLNYWSIIFDIPKENFKAFTSGDNLWA